jgi:predicted aspartyl protease
VPKPAGSPDSNAAVAAKADDQDHLTIETMIDGRGPFRFVVDTGADRTVISDDVARRMGLAGGDQVLVEGIVRTIPAGTVLVRELAFGPVVRHDMAVPVLPRALLGADGYLGLDAVDGYRVTFDFASHLLRVDRSETSASDAAVMMTSGVRLPATGDFGHLKTIRCSVDGIRATAFIDSGAQVTIGNPELARALLTQDSAIHRTEGTVPLTGVTGGYVQGQVTAIQSVQLRELTFSIPQIVIADLQIFEIWGLRDTPALLIGMNYLNRFARVTVDYGTKQFRFDLAALTIARRS